MRHSASRVSHWLCLLVIITLNFRGAKAQPADTLFSHATLAAANRDFDSAYLLYEKSGEAYLDDGATKEYLRCRIEMARSSQFTSIVSREAIKVIIDPAISLIEQNNQLKNTREAAECYQFLARYHWAIQGNYDDAIEYYQAALEICQLVGDSSNQEKMATMADLSHVYSNKEEFDLALEYAAGALALSKQIYGEDHVENGPRYYNLGFTYYRKGHYDRAISEITKGINILQKNQGPEMQIGLGYNNLSAVYVAQLDQEAAMQSSQAAMDIFSKFLGPEHEAIGIIEWDLGVMYLDLKQHMTALGHLKNAREIFEANFGPSFPQLPQLFHQIGQCHDQLSQFAEAEIWHNKAFQINRDRYGTSHVRTGESFRNLAQHYILSSQFNKAHDAVAGGLSIVHNPENQSDLLRAWLYEQKGSLLYEQGDYTGSALAFDSASLAVSLPGTTLATLDADQTFNPLFFTDYQSQKAKTEFRAYQEQGDQHMLRESLVAARLAHQGIRTLRLSYQSAKSKLFLQERARSHYAMMMDILFELWQLNNDQVYLEEAWKVSEETKSLLLLEEIKSAEITFHNIPAIVLDTLKMLKQDLAFFEQAVLEEMETEDIEAVKENQEYYRQTSTRIQLYEQEIQADYPQYRSIFQDMSTTPIKDIQTKLEDHTTLIEYFITDSAIYSFGVRVDKLLWSKNKKHELDAALQSLLAESRNLEKVIDNPTKALNDYVQMSNHVYGLIFPSALISITEDARKLIIVPDQQLAYISFEALSRKPEAPDFLIQDFAFTYAYSASIWHLHDDKADPVTLNNFGGFAPSYETMSDSFPRDALAMVSRSGDHNLPGARQEVSEIESVISGEVWVDDQATEQAFKQHAPNYKLLHLALHGIVDEKEPMKSKLLFYQGEDESGELHAYEIYNLPLQANLAVLSACNTATGMLHSGEGIMSLSRAFAYAGVPNLIASLWRADDVTSSKIMVEFYAGLTRQLPKDEALRAAKLSFLQEQKTQTHQHPYFWSHYILIGENHSHFAMPFPLHWLLLGLACVAMLLYFGWSKKTLT